MVCLDVNNNSQLRKFNDNHRRGVWFVWFYADWCGHCHQMKEPWNQFEQSNVHNINLAKVRDDYVPKVNSNPSIQGWPTILLYKNGKIVDMYQGERTPDAFNEYLGNNISETEKRLNMNLNRNVNQPNTVVKLNKPNKKSRKSKSSRNSNSNSNSNKKKSGSRKRRGSKKQTGSVKRRRIKKTSTSQN